MGILESLLERGFTFRSFPVYPRHLGIVKYNCAALLELTPEGKWKQFSSTGYLLEDQIALLVEREGRPTFVYKSKQLPAEGEPLASLRRFEQELQSALEQQS
jgi:hypothetical protein